jgi:protein SERAC1
MSWLSKMSPERPSSPISLPDGVEILHDCPDAIVDICFVHGLSGNRHSTWTADGESAPWPKTLLLPELSKARILTYGYNAYVVGGAGSNQLVDHAKNLLNDLAADRARQNASSRALIFVAHSLGGLVCKKAMSLSRNSLDDHLKPIFNSIKGFIFMGTPHEGSDWANWAKIPASALSMIKSTNQSLLDILLPDNQFLEDIHVEFCSMIREEGVGGRHVEVVCFYEELPLSQMIGKVVSKQSATISSHPFFSIHADHKYMVKFRSNEDSGFKRVLTELDKWVKAIKDSVATKAETQTMAGTDATWSYHNSGPGTQFNNTGSGYQFPGASFSGNVSFGKGS